jgi:hypothetical protein
MSGYTITDLKKNFERQMISFKESMVAFPWEDKNSYAQWLAHSYFYVSHSTRLLAMAASRCELTQHSIHKRFIDHLAEEQGHEKLAISDLRKLGFEIDKFREMSETALFYQNQYYWLGFHGALPFLGWILALEGGAVHTCGLAYARVLGSHGAASGLFLKIHAEEDIDHLDKVMNQIEGLPAASLQLIEKNLGQSCHLYMSALKKITDDVHSPKRLIAA